MGGSEDTKARKAGKFKPELCGTFGRDNEVDFTVQDMKKRNLLC